MNDELVDVLGRFTEKHHYSAGQVAALSGVPKRTIMNWLSGRVRRPHDWRRLVQVAAALRLNEMGATELLQSAGHPAIAELRREATAVSDQQLLEAWPDTSGAPFQAIPDLPYFVGREAALTELGDMLRNGRSVTLYSLHGMGGVGKTALAAHLAYKLRPAFPDGVLWARLDTSDTMAILAYFAAAYGQDVSMHHDVATRAGVVRAILADKQALIVLDNAQTSAQIRPLLPASMGKTAVLITTRHDLAVSDNMRRFSIESFTPDSGDSLAVFTHFLGQTSMRRWQPELQEIANLLGHLPLAIAIAAGRLAAQIAVPDYLSQLRAAEQRLASLIREDRSIRLSFNLSYQALSPQLRQFFISLGVFGGDDFSTAAAAHVADIPTEISLDFLNELIGLSLVQPGRPNRYSLHALLRDYAREKQKNDQIWRRMATYFVEYAARYVADSTQVALELSNMIHALDTASDLQMPEMFIKGTLNVFPTWYAQGNIATAVPYLKNALTLAADTADHQQQATAISYLGSSYWGLGDPETAEKYHTEGLQLAHKLEDAKLISRFLINLGSIAGAYYGNYEKAQSYLSEALKHTQTLNNPDLTVPLLTNLANVAYEQGDWAKAGLYWREGLTELMTHGRATSLENVHLHRNLGILAMVRGKFDKANNYLNEALSIARDLDSAMFVGTTLAALGQVACEQGLYHQAKMLLDEALTAGRNANYPEATAQALCNLGQWAIYTNDFPAAAAYLQEARALTQQSDIAWMESSVLINLGELHLKKGDAASAQEAFASALAITEALNVLEQKGIALYGLARSAFPSNNNQSLQLARESLAILEGMEHYAAVKVQHWLQEYFAS